MKRALLLTGRPGTGKTAIVKEASAQTKVNAAGFYAVTQAVNSGKMVLGTIILRSGSSWQPGTRAPRQPRKPRIGWPSTKAADKDSADRLG